MKNISSLIYICIVVSAINIIAILFYSRPSAKESPVVSMTQSDSDAPFSDVIIPEKFDLAGEEVPLQRIDVQEALKKEVIVNTYLHSHTIQILKSSPRVFGIIEPILKKNGVPDDFKYLAVIESRLDPSAVSSAGAVGVWQFMKNTGQEFGLEVNDEVDERYCIEKSTEAAAAYLKKAYTKFGSWTLAAAAYNAGSSMISKQMNIQKESNYYDLLLGEETGRYVFRILALKQIMAHPDWYNFKVNIRFPEENIRKVKVDTSVKDWADFAQTNGISYKILKRFNPWLRKNSLHNGRGKSYEVCIPVQTELYK